MNVLLVVPRFSPVVSSDYVFPLGLGYVSAALKRAGHTVVGLNLNHVAGSETDLVAAAVSTHGSQIVAVGGISVFYAAIKNVLDAAAALSTRPLTVLGGGIVTAAPVGIYDLLNPDYAVIGEGEITVLELLAAVEAGGSCASVAGLVYRRSDGVVVQTSPRLPNKNPQDLPWPDYEASGLFAKWVLQEQQDAEAQLVLPIAASRSCPFDCTFCFHPLGRGYRKFELEGVFAQLHAIRRQHVFHHVAIGDELFAPDPCTLKEFCRDIREFDVTWEVQLRVDAVDVETVCTMREAGCRAISYGIESMSPVVLKSMRKHTTPEQVDRALRLTYELNVEIQGNLIFGDEAETMATATESLAWWMAHREYQVFLSAIRIYPGSPLYQRAVGRGLIEPRTFLPKGGGIVNVTSMSNDEFSFITSQT